jgi:hypothetical protein
VIVGGLDIPRRETHLLRLRLSQQTRQRRESRHQRQEDKERLQEAVAPPQQEAVYVGVARLDADESVTCSYNVSMLRYVKQPLFILRRASLT